MSSVLAPNPQYCPNSTIEDLAHGPIVPETLVDAVVLGFKFKDDLGLWVSEFWCFDSRLQSLLH